MTVIADKSLLFSLKDYLKDNALKIIILVLFALVYMHYFFNASFRHFNISIVLILLSAYCIFKSKFIQPNQYLILFCSIGFLGVTLMNHLTLRLDLIPEHLYRTYKAIINQYLWFIPFILLPTLYHYSRFKVSDFFNIIATIIFILILYLAYWGIALEFDRGRFAIFFNPVISYDIGFISLSLLLLCYSFGTSSKQSYLYLILSMLCIFLLVLHGSRGTWVGLPFAFLVITILYLKSQLKKTLLMWALACTFILGNVITPNSPVAQRMNHLQDDSQHIQNNNYQNSSGIRLYLWENSLAMFKRSPIIGIGMHEIELENCRLYERGNLPHCFQHLHSIYFHELAANGLIGLLTLLSTFLVAMAYFLKNLWVKDELTRNLSVTGAVFVIYYMFCGLTEYYLFFMNTTYVFYWVTASLISFIMLRHAQRH